MGLRTSIKARLRSLRHKEIGDAFRPEHDVVFARFDQTAEGVFQLVGSACVGTWEVALTDVARAYEGFLLPGDVPKLSERMSDALVPFLQPIQGLGNGFRGALKTGTKDALKSGQLSDVTRPMARVLWAVGQPVQEGWLKATGYLEPLIEKLADKDAIRADFESQAPAFGKMMTDAAGVFAAKMDALPRGDTLEEPLVEALETYSHVVRNQLELMLYARRTTLVESARRMPARTS